MSAAPTPAGRGAGLLEVEGLAKAFRLGAARLQALRGASLRLARGEALGLAGESGCGKSTLARCVLRLERPDAGSVRFAGEESRAAAAAAAENLVVITVQGIDKPGIIATVAGEVARQHGNVTDLSQTILAGVFVMVLVVDLAGTDGYDAMVEGLERVGQELGMEISVRLYSVYEAMHRI